MNSERSGYQEQAGQERFPHWKTRPIVRQLEKYLQTEAIAIPETTKFYLPQGTAGYEKTSQLVGKMIADFPLHDEVGSTKLMRDDTPHILNELAALMRGEKRWDEAAEIFNFPFEVFKNEVYQQHNIPTAICYNLDLAVNFLSPSSNGFALDRIQMRNANGRMLGIYDGRFDVNQYRIIIDTHPAPINVHHK